MIWLCENTFEPCLAFFCHPAPCTLHRRIFIELYRFCTTLATSLIYSCFPFPWDINIALLIFLRLLILHNNKATLVAINPWQLYYNYYISHLIGPHCGMRIQSSIVTDTVNKPAKKQIKEKMVACFLQGLMGRWVASNPPPFGQYYRRWYVIASQPPTMH